MRSLQQNAIAKRGKNIITTMAGAQGATYMTVEELQTAIASSGRPYKQRQTIY